MVGAPTLLRDRGWGVLLQHCPESPVPPGLALGATGDTTDATGERWGDPQPGTSPIPIQWHRSERRAR